MQHVVKHDPSSTMLEITLGPGESLVAAAGAMVAWSPDVRMQVLLSPGPGAGLFGRLKALLVALVRRLVGGASFLVNRVSSSDGGWVWLAPALRGQVMRVPLEGGAMLFAPGAFLASAGDVTLRVKWAGLRSILSRRGAFLLEAAGSGDLWISGHGALSEVACDGAYVVDAGHIVGFDASLGFAVHGTDGDLPGFVLPDQGVTCELSGRGRVLVQSRDAGSLVRWLAPLLPS